MMRRFAVAPGGFQLANDVLECFDDLVEFDLFFRRLNRLGFAA
jgi:hypothetical protein